MRPRLVSIIDGDTLPTMANREDLDSVRERLVKDSVASMDKFSKKGAFEFRYTSPEERRMFQVLDTFVEAISETVAASLGKRIQSGNDLVEFAFRLRRPKGLHTLVRRLSKTSSVLRSWPARACARPRSMLARSSGVSREATYSIRSRSSSASTWDIASTNSWRRSFVDMPPVYQREVRPYPSAARSWAAARRTWRGAVPPGMSRAASAESTEISRTSEAKRSLPAR